MWKMLVLVAALLLSGCAAQEPSDDGTAQDLPGASTGAAPFLAQPSPIRFASGDFEGMTSGEATFGPTDFCFPECSANADQEFDLTAIVPADAPVELSIVIEGNARGELEFVDATPVIYQSEFQGQGSQISAIVTRGQSGAVILHLYSSSGFSFPPGQSSAATFEARSVVRADRLVAYVPAAIKMQPGESLNLTGDDVEEALLIAPDGSITRDSTAPFTLTANGTAGTYVVIMAGDDSTYVYGPNTTMTAKRISYVESEMHALASGSATTWSFTPESRPLQVGMAMQSMTVTGVFFPVGTMSTYEMTLTGPGGVLFIDEGQSCTPDCALAFGGDGWPAFAGEYLDERLASGPYDVSVTYTGNNMQAYSWYVVIA